jgi:hypothetical protein
VAAALLPTQQIRGDRDAALLHMQRTDRVKGKLRPGCVETLHGMQRSDVSSSKALSGRQHRGPVTGRR